LTPITDQYFIFIPVQDYRNICEYKVEGNGKFVLALPNRGYGLCLMTLRL
jgi:hypothetical protein